MSNSTNSLKFFKIKEQHQYHLVDNSFFPVVTGFVALLVTSNLIYYWRPSMFPSVHSIDNLMLQLSLIFFIFSLLGWFCMVLYESSVGYHTKVVRNGIRIGMLLFIVSEIMFFFAFFWGFFHVSLSPALVLGYVWPPQHFQEMDIWGLPLVNTVLLLSSGVTITLSHHSLINRDTWTSHKVFAKYLLFTIILGVTFLICQGIEYKYGVSFSWKEGIYGSIFFLITGFHGFHVTVGTIFLLFCYVREIYFLNFKFMSKINSKDFFSRNIIRSTFVFFYISIKNILIVLLSIQNYLGLSLISSASILNLINKLDYLISHFNSPKIPYYYTRQINNAAYLSNFRVTQKQHLGFQASVWYWHFVDVVWLFLFITVYWWGS